MPENPQDLGLCQLDNLTLKRREEENQLIMILCTQSNLPHFFSVLRNKQCFPCDYEEACLSVLRDSTHTTSVLCQLQFSRCWWGPLTLILSVTMFSNYHSLHTNMIAWLAVLFPWQLLWFWLCQSFHSLLHVASNSSSSSRSLFISPHVSDGCLRYILSFYSRKTF